MTLKLLRDVIFISQRLFYAYDMSSFQNATHLKPGHRQSMNSTPRYDATLFLKMTEKTGLILSFMPINRWSSSLLRCQCLRKGSNKDFYRGEGMEQGREGEGEILLRRVHENSFCTDQLKFVSEIILNLLFTDFTLIMISKSFFSRSLKNEPSLSKENSLDVPFNRQKRILFSYYLSFSLFRW